MNREGLDVEGCLLKLGGVVSDECERTESELAAHDQTTARYHVDED